MIEGSCRCGAVHWQFQGQPDAATACNCTTCRRYGALWIYGYENEDVTVSGSTQTYTPRTSLVFHFCGVCGCVVCWRSIGTDASGRRRVGINVRLAEPAAVAAIPIDHFDGLDSFEPLPSDGRRVSDYLH